MLNHANRGLLASRAKSVFLAQASNISPYINVYNWSSSGFGTKFSDPGTLPTGIGYGVAFSPAGTEIAVAHQTTPFISAYTRSYYGYGSKFSNPGSLPSGDGFAITFGEI